MLSSIFEQLCEFSRCHCIAICGGLVPFNLILSFLTLVYVVRQAPPSLIQKNAIAVYGGVTLMVLHVSTWFLIGVVMIPTFLLPAFGAVCVAINLWGTQSPNSLRRFLLWLWQSVLNQRGRATI
ncbi:hypothetical protein NIES970_07590 [[Synechococcus] sp. NIES-970]|uniref:hypothetical protein n=1 Tax=Picosynechococcus sp. NKBG15041c TaxID=1407650 RepID=UPI0004135A3F|nr:hypothetical protein [Picosynechococcus sp. NKBG15041c]BAW95845.1 hypothetical protein NIES970_07590 [[Synechococcus] sp. NIES-970]